MGDAQFEEKVFYARLTSPELKEAVKRQCVVLIPVGTVEAHGPHLPLDTDNYIAFQLALAAGRRIPDEVLIAPLIPYAFNIHFIDYPGTIAVQSEHFMNYCLDVSKSIAYHGFRRIIFVNNHGPNIPYLSIISMRTNLESDALCTHVSSLSQVDVMQELRESKFPGGISHACEMETSILLYLDPTRVQMDKAVKEMGFPRGKYFWRDVAPRPPVELNSWWSCCSVTSVSGDPTLATREKGEKLFTADVDRLVDIIREFKQIEMPQRRDFH